MSNYAAKVLVEAANIVAGARNTTHGDVERSFALIAKFWTLYLEARMARAATSVTAVDVAQMMVLMKVARSIQGTPLREHFLDEAGYAALAAELAADLPPSAPVPAHVPAVPSPSPASQPSPPPSQAPGAPGAPGQAPGAPPPAAPSPPPAKPPPPPVPPAAASAKPPPVAVVPPAVPAASPPGDAFATLRAAGGVAGLSLVPDP